MELNIFCTIFRKKTATSVILVMPQAPDMTGKSFIVDYDQGKKALSRSKPLILGMKC